MYGTLVMVTMKKHVEKTFLKVLYPSKFQKFKNFLNTLDCHTIIINLLLITFPLLLILLLEKKQHLNFKFIYFLNYFKNFSQFRGVFSCGCPCVYYGLLFHGFCVQRWGTKRPVRIQPFSARF